jgi:hypothetical protein
MGRGEAVLLNGAPPAILLSRALDLREDNESWKSAPGYAALLQQYPDAFPWVEYGGPLAEHQADDGSILIAADFDMRECRACPNVASFRVEFRFDPRGFLSGKTVLPPGPPAR